MPSSIVVKHNDRTMTFNEESHSYVDDNRKRYCSVTTLVGMGFEKFDAERIAKQLAAKRGEDDWQHYIDLWRKEGQEASNFGTRLHHNCEHMILGRYDECYEPTTIQERINFSLAEKQVEKIKSDENACKFEPEKLVFSNRLGLAGSIDLLVTNKDGSYIIYDWKNIKELKKDGFMGKTGILECTKTVQDSNYWHYALQLQLYEIILKVDGYVPKDAKFNRRLCVFSNSSFSVHEMPNVMNEAKGLILWLNKKV